MLHLHGCFFGGNLRIPAKNGYDQIRSQKLLTESIQIAYHMKKEGSFDQHGSMETLPGEAFETATLGGGCFWCVEAIYQRVEGILSVVSGYAGGNEDTANYNLVSSGRTQHAEVVQLKFDPGVISFEQVLEIVDFAVVYDDNGFILVVQRLYTAGEVDNGEPSVGQTHTSLQVNPFLIRPPVILDVVHPREQRAGNLAAATRIEYARNAAHDASRYQGG